MLVGVWIRLQKEYLKSKRVFLKLQTSVVRLCDPEEKYILSLEVGR